MVRFHQRFFLCQLDVSTSGPSSDAADPLAVAGSFTTADIFNSIRLVMMEVFGDAGMGKLGSGLAVKYYSPLTRLMVIRGPAAHVDMLHAAIALVKSCKKQPVAFRTLQVCGSVRVLKSSLTHWHATLTSSLKTSLGRDSVVLDDGFFEALDLEAGGGLQI